MRSGMTKRTKLESFALGRHSLRDMIRKALRYRMFVRHCIPPLSILLFPGRLNLVLEYESARATVSSALSN